MISGFLLRLAVALPVILLSIVGALVLLRKSGWEPGGLMARKTTGGHPARKKTLEVQEMKTLLPGARLAVARFGETDYLLGVTGSAIRVLATKAAEGGRE